MNLNSIVNDVKINDDVGKLCKYKVLLFSAKTVECIKTVDLAFATESTDIFVSCIEFRYCRAKSVDI